MGRYHWTVGECSLLILLLTLQYTLYLRFTVLMLDKCTDVQRSMLDSSGWVWSSGREGGVRGAHDCLPVGAYSGSMYN